MDKAQMDYLASEDRFMKEKTTTFLVDQINEIGHSDNLMAMNATYFRLLALELAQRVEDGLA